MQPDKRLPPHKRKPGAAKIKENGFSHPSSMRRAA
jgi:hypothetical protein